VEGQHFFKSAVVKQISTYIPSNCGLHTSYNWNKYFI